MLFARGETWFMLVSCVPRWRNFHDGTGPVVELVVRMGARPKSFDIPTCATDGRDVLVKASELWRLLALAVW